MNQMTLFSEAPDWGPLVPIGPGVAQGIKIDGEMTADEFTQQLNILKDEKRYTIFELSEILCHPVGTVRNWTYRGIAPEQAMRSEVIRIVSDSPVLSKAVQNELARLYNLTWEARKRRWRLRLTINVGKKVVGKRITVDLKSGDAKSAIQQRAVIISAYEKLGLTICNRHKKAKS